MLPLLDLNFFYSFSIIKIKKKKRLLYNKSEKKLLPDPREIQKEKMMHILALSYHFYGELLKIQEK